MPCFFRQGDAVDLWRMARGEEDDRCARVRAAVLRAVLCAGPCGAAVAAAGARSRKRVK